jgi:trehalose-6-phosphate synthase
MSHSMKIIIKAIIISGLVILVIVAFPVGRFIFEMISFDHEMEKQMKIGQKYMDSLTDKDIQVWIQRSEKYLKEDDPKDFTTDARPVSVDLQQLGILGIEEDTNWVDYVWVGGMDRTDLSVYRMTNESFQVTAFYNIYSNRVIWPK